jgi:eukaryotic-like serine/threonine-protein kinase
LTKAGWIVAHDDPRLNPGVREGDVLAGKYRVDKVLGVGGMGVVVAARHLQLETRVAIKFLLPGMLDSEEAVVRFAREARAAVRITSEHVARVFDVGTLETGAPYIVMEYLEGGDLAEWVRQRGALPIELAIEFVLQACVAVAEAHGLGIVHRDLKPANLFCVRRPDGQLLIKVLDFGISKTINLSGSEPALAMTKTSAMMGSPVYMSPEQMQSPRDVDAQTDLWALGVILYELLTGSVPFKGDTLPEVCIKIATHATPPLRAVRPEVPAQLEAVIGKCLEKHRRNRYRNVGELAVALAEFGPSRVRASVERVLGTVRGAGLPAMGPSLPPMRMDVTVTQAPAGTISPVGRTTRGRTGSADGGGAARPWRLLGVVASLLAAGGVLVAIVETTRAPAAARASPVQSVEAGQPSPPPAVDLPAVAVVVAASAEVPAGAPGIGPSISHDAVPSKASPAQRTPHSRPGSLTAPTTARPPVLPFPNAPPAPERPPEPTSSPHAAPLSNPLDLPLQ